MKDANHIVLRLSNSQVALLAAAIKAHGEAGNGNYSAPVDDTGVASYYEAWLSKRQGAS